MKPRKKRFVSVGAILTLVALVIARCVRRLDRRKGAAMRNVWLAIIATDKGEQLYPICNKKRPKPFCRLGKDSFIQATAKRFISIGVDPKHIVVITADWRQQKWARRQLREIGVDPRHVRKVSRPHSYAGAMVCAAEYVYSCGHEAIIINTPVGHFVDMQNGDFMQTISRAVSAATWRRFVMVGVKGADLATFKRRGHALYDPAESGEEKTNWTITGYVEKLTSEMASEMMHGNNSAVDTGICVWQARLLCEAIPPATSHKDCTIETKELMDTLRKYGGGSLKLVIGSFKWQDCDTLKAIYDTNIKDSNGNAILGNGRVRLANCNNSLFHGIKEVDLFPANVKDAAVAVGRIGEKIAVIVTPLEHCQMVGDLARLIEEHGDEQNCFVVPIDGKYSTENILADSNCPDRRYVAGFVCGKYCTVAPVKGRNGRTSILVSYPKK